MSEKVPQNIPEYDFDIIKTLKEGFKRIEGKKGLFVGAFLIYVAVAMAVQMVLSLFFPMQNAAGQEHLLNQQIVTLLSYPVLMPIMVGIIMLAVDDARGKPLNIKSVFGYYHMTWTLALAGVLIYLMTLLGILFFILPGIYLSVSYLFTLPLIADKQMPVWDAMELSRKTITRHWFKVFGLVLILSLLMLGGILTFGIGLVWAVPVLFTTLYGLLYTSIFDETNA
ncbi:hypothetical protein [Sulfurovum sp.]|uniref:hypothetical protein n=1 Tax=Sulfurovum sp. TaxID=1969726 RepID=UPI0025D738B6|nr:hypothetical protein [Sulfurovum sp.]